MYETKAKLKKSIIIGVIKAFMLLNCILCEEIYSYPNLKQVGTITLVFVNTDTIVYGPKIVLTRLYFTSSFSSVQVLHRLE